MKRLFGMMPNKCVKISKMFKDDSNLNVMIEAGPKGWTIIWADRSATYRDENNTSENNFKKAYNTAVAAVGPLREI